MSRRPLDPRSCNIALDANALDSDGSASDTLVDRFRKLSVAGGPLMVVTPAGVRGEIQHPRTPDAVKGDVLPRIFNLQAGLNPTQQQNRSEVAAILRGNAKPERHAADASHLSEAAETGCGYFVTHDKRIIGKRVALSRVLPPSLNIVTLAEFFQILDDYERQRT